MTEVCWVVHGSENYGLARAVRNLAAALAAEGVTTRFLATTDGEFVRELRAAGLPVGVLGLPRLPVLEVAAPRRLPGQALRWGVASLGLARALRRHPWIHEGQVVHVIWPNLLLGCGLSVLPRRRGRRVVWEMANAIGGPGPVASVYRALTRLLGISVIANSGYTASTLLRGPGPAIPLPVMHLSAAPDYFPATPLPPDRRDTGPRPAELVMAARFHPTKMQLDVVQALAALAAAGELPPEGVRLVLVGNRAGSDYEEAVAKAAAAAEQPLEVVLEPVRDDVSPFLAAADVVLAVRRDPEPFGLTVVEAMMSGRPVLAGSHGGPGETVLDGTTGWLADDLSAAGLRKALIRLLADRSRWPEMGAAAAAHARAGFSPRAQAARYRRLTGV